MGTLGDNIEVEPIKALLIAHSGFGKTGALASLVKAGYKLHILDMDNGVAVIRSYLPKELWSKVEVETYQDQFKVINGKAVATGSTAWPMAMAKLDSWVNQYRSIEHIIVVDSLTMLSEAAMRNVLAINNRLAGMVYQSDWGEAQRLVEGALALMYSKSTKCNIIVNSHISYIGGPDTNLDPKDAKDAQPTAETVQPLKGHPTTIGKALSPKVARYFNNAFVGKTIGEGSNALRLIYTAPMDLVDAKSSNPTVLKLSYPIATGLAEMFQAIRPYTPSA